MDPSSQHTPHEIDGKWQRLKAFRMTDTHRIRVLMLGWEYPPHISGGLGTACEGLTRALAPLDLDIDFVVPALYGVEQASHMRLTSPDLPPPPEPDSIQAMNLVRYERGSERVMLQPGASGELAVPEAIRTQHTTTQQVPGGVEVVPIPALLSPYITSTEYKQWLRMLERADTHEELLMRERMERFDRAAVFGEVDGGHDEVMETTRAPSESHYGRDLYAEVARFATRVGVWARRRHCGDANHWKVGERSSTVNPYDHKTDRMRGKFATLVLALAAAGFPTGAAGVSGAGHCRVIAGDKLPAATGGAKAVCAAVLTFSLNRNLLPGE